MPDYSFKTIDNAGKVRADHMIASNPMELEKRLGSMGFDLLSYTEKAQASKLFGRRGISRRDLVNFTFHIEQLIKAGVPLIECLKDVRNSMDYNHFTDVLQTIIDDIEGGSTLSIALTTHPQIFDNVYVALIKVGEETGKLPEVLKELTQTLRFQDELISRTKKIMIYPIIVSVVILLVVSFLLIVLLPQLLPFIKSVGTEIPTHTKILMVASDAFIDYWYIIFTTPVVLYFLLKASIKRFPKFEYAVDNFKLHLWLFGPLILKIRLARFANYFAMMYSSGSSVLNALQISEQMMDNKVLEQSVRNARQKISDGMQMSESFESTGVFPSMIVRILKVGEDTGAMDDALLNVSYFYNREVREYIDKIEPAMMPLLTLILGGLMMWIMSAVLGPVYDAVSSVKI